MHWGEGPIEALVETSDDAVFISDANGLARIIEVLETARSPVLADLAGDHLIASLMLVHGLHPDALSIRVERALDQVRPVLEQHGGDVELLDIDPAAGAVHLRLLGNCDGCPSSSITLQTAVERAIVEAAPEIVIIDVDQPARLEAPSFAATDDGPASAPVALIPKPRYDSCPSEVAAL